jgi:acyl-CoA reductase-like NAD-dependent aldehyde dehydrogenase
MTIKIVQAYDRAPFAKLEEDDAAALAAKLERAQKAFADRNNWLKPHQRIAILHKLAALMSEKREHLAKQIAREGGKPLTDALIETDRAIDGVRNAAEVLREQSGREIPMGLTPASEGRRAFTIIEPIGIVAAISAFNHPLNLIVHQVVPAIAAGCPVIVKPATTTPLSCVDLVEMVRKAGLPEAWCQTFLTSSNELAQKLATDKRAAFLSFIGSARVGWQLRAALPPGTRCALEHGGVAPAIIDKSADLGRLIEPLVKGGYYHAGQVCVSVQRIFVHADLEREFLDRFSARVAALKTGDPVKAETEMGPLILPAETERVEAWIDEAVQGGGTLIGGGRLSATTLKPAIVVSPPAHSKLMTQEVFGPVTCVTRYTDLDAAIAQANSLPYAFQAAIFAENLRTAMRAAERIDASAVMINDHTAFRTDWMPFAGRKQSGYGVGGIPYTMQEMSQEKMIVLKQ